VVFFDATGVNLTKPYYKEGDVLTAGLVVTNINTNTVTLLLRSGTSTNASSNTYVLDMSGIAVMNRWENGPWSVVGSTNSSSASGPPDSSVIARMKARRELESQQ